ncbi:hypothetical protein [Micromonospora antibiotica]|uniref:Uncharacterized protein n=1 Tax=Micromonospora antibiotica TaxID=2807623 RepID=A0ABS3V3A9_9ACTN|nr:hypothetical protein [Micromonospora antibiotica]MBO4160106.1 hypothetical protein [Micromonospora antibiotica]
MLVRIAAVRLGVPTMVDATLADIRLSAEWLGTPPQPGDLVDVEMDIDDMLGWGKTIAMAGNESTLRDGPRLHGVVEHHEQQVLTIRIGVGLLQVELHDGSTAIPPGTAVFVVVENPKLYPTGA